MSKPMQADCKSERIVEMRLAKKSWAEIVAAVGGTKNAAKVLYHWRKTRSSRLLADMSKLPQTEGATP